MGSRANVPAMASFERARLLGSDLPEPVRARRALALDLLEAALEAIEPERGTLAAIHRLSLPETVTAFAFGKASVAMARAARGAVRVQGGILIALGPERVGGLTTYVGAHPDPAAGAEIAGRAVRDRALSLGAGDVALCLVSGGGSSMLELPREGITLASLVACIRDLRERGAEIGEINAVRRACSQLKGGGLARLCAPASVSNVILSDVPGHPVEVVASGPSCAPPREAPDPAEVLAKYGLGFDLPRADPGPLPEIRTEVAGSNATACRALVGRAGQRGLRIDERAGTFGGDAASLGRAIATERHDDGWIWGGETTVAVRGRGRGGRNQELALGALAAGWGSGLLVATSTDGVDGASDAAGALVDEAVVAAARRRGLDPERFLRDNDSFHFFDALGANLVSGPTGTNVADLCLYLP